MAVTATLLATIDPSGSGASVFTQSVTVASGTTQLIVHVHTQTRSVSSITFGAAGFSQIGATGALNATYKFEAWHLDAPTAGTDTVTLTMSATGNCVAYIIAVSGSATSSAFGTWAQTTGTSTVTVTSAVGELPLIAIEAQSGGTNTITDTSSPALTLIDKRVSAATTNLVGVFSGTGASSVVASFTIANSGGVKLVAGYSIKPATATTQTFYLLDSAATSSSHGQLQLGGSAPTAATTTTGWTVGSSAVDTYSLLAYGSERASSTFGSTALPGASIGTTDCWRSASTITGQFAAGDWDLSFALRAVDQGGTQDGAIRVRMWRSTDPTGSGATEITSGATQLSTITNLATGSDGVSSGTITLGAVTLAAEYLFVSIAWRVTGAA